MSQESARQYPPPSFVAEAQRAFRAQMIEVSPCQRLAEDLLQVLTANPELVQGGVQGATWKDLPQMAEKCLEAAGRIYPEPSFSGLGTPRPPTEREVAYGLGLAATLSPPQPAGESLAPAAAEGVQAVVEPVINPEWTPPYASFDRAKEAHPRCGAVHGAHVCARHAGHAGIHASASGLVGWNEEHEPWPMGAMTTAVTDHEAEKENP